MSFPDRLLEPPADKKYCERHDRWYERRCPDCDEDRADEKTRGE
jgi:hypothetical protein